MDSNPQDSKNAGQSIDNSGDYTPNPDREPLDIKWLARQALADPSLFAYSFAALSCVLAVFILMLPARLRGSISVGHVIAWLFLGLLVFLGVALASAWRDWRPTLSVSLSAFMNRAWVSGFAALCLAIWRWLTALLGVQMPEESPEDDPPVEKPSPEALKLVSSAYSSPPRRLRLRRDTIFIGPRGGRYRVSRNGKKYYPSRSPAASASFSPATRPSAPFVPPAVISPPSRLRLRQDTIFIGPRGGRYRINSKGKKTYDV